MISGYAIALIRTLDAPYAGERVSSRATPGRSDVGERTGEHAKGGPVGTGFRDLNAPTLSDDAAGDVVSVCGGACIRLRSHCSLLKYLY